jgi:hypothetical protein
MARINIPRLDKTYGLNQVRLGYKNQMVKKTSGYCNCNAKDGNNTEVAAGTTAKFYYG